jgi:hypothetical protein
MAAINVISRLYDEAPRRIVTEVIVQQSAEWCKQNGLIPEKVKARALWDTGAEICVVSAELVKRLNLLKYGTEWVVGYETDSERDTYYIDITLGDNRHIYNLPAVFNPRMKSQDIIIGMEAITLGDFALIRESGGIRFMFKME